MSAPANRLARFFEPPPRPYQVWLVDPKGQRGDLLAFEHADKQAVEAWLDRWSAQPPDVREGLHAAVRIRPAHRPPPRPSTGDVLVASAYGLKIEVLRLVRDEDEGPELCVEFELRGNITTDDAAGVFHNLLTSLQQRREGEGGEAHA